MGYYKRAYEIVNTVPGQKSISAGEKTIDFSKGDLVIEENEEAASSLKGDPRALVLETEVRVSNEQGHRYMFYFGNSERYREGWERIFGRKNKKGKRGVRCRQR